MNSMRQPFIAKVILSAGATGNDLVKAQKLLEIIAKRKAQIIKAGAKQRIPELGVKPGLELGTRITLRGKAAMVLLNKLLGAVENKLARSSVAENHFSFGIEEYIDIPDMEYVREIGIRGFNVTVVFERHGLRVKHKKIKRGTIPARQRIKAEEVIQVMEDTFKTKFE